MNTSFLKRVRLAVMCVCSLFIMLLFSACSGVMNGAGTGTGATISGSIQSINAANHSVTVNANGQILTVSNLTDQQIAALKAQIGKTYTFHVQETQANANSYTMSTNSDPIETDNATPIVNATVGTVNEGANVLGSISFMGKVQRVNGNTLLVAMPNGQVLSMRVVSGQSDLTNTGGTIPAVNTLVKVEANANTDGSFTTAKLETTDANDTQDVSTLNTVDIQGITTQAVGSDNVVHIKVGSKSFVFTLSSTSELKDFANTQAIANNQSVKLAVLFSGSNGTVLKIENGNG